MANYLGVLHGTLGGTLEIFQHTIAVTSNQSQAEVASRLRDSFEDVWAAGGMELRDVLSGSVEYVYVTAAEILDLTGPELSLMAANRADWTPPLQGSQGTAGVFQQALAVSLTAGTYPNGSPVRGRFYLPPVSPSILSSGRISGAGQTLIADWANAWMDAMIGLSLIPCVWSRGAAKHGSTTGFLSPVTSLRVGQVADTVRRRRGALLEQYISRLVP
jgi:hypothetical protein